MVTLWDPVEFSGIPPHLSPAAHGGMAQGSVGFGASACTDWCHCSPRNSVLCPPSVSLTPRPCWSPCGMGLGVPAALTQCQPQGFGMLQPLLTKILPHSGWEKMLLASGEVSLSLWRDFPSLLLLLLSAAPRVQQSWRGRWRTGPLLSEAQRSIKYLHKELLRQLHSLGADGSVGPQSRAELLGGLEGPGDLALGDVPGSAGQCQPPSKGAHMILAFLSF